MKKYFYFAAALLTLASCANDDFVGENEDAATGQKAIAFNMQTPTTTRADQDHETSAASLGNQFIVYGEKSETTDGAAPKTGKLVFPNYQVNYAASTANSTESNTKDWEYVGYTHSTNYQSNIKYGTTAVSSEAQTIKYWDYSASNYVFTAVSAKQDDIDKGYVKITKTTAATSGNKVYDKGYTLELTTNASLDNIYLSDRNEITTGNNTTTNEANKYGGNVQLRFRRLSAKVRVGFYETIPGYSVKIDKFYYVDGVDKTFTEMTSENTTNFAANVPNVASGTAGTVTVTYYKDGTLQNQPTASMSATAANYITLGANVIGTELGVTSAAATYDIAAKTYTSVFPQESNTKTMKVKVDYTLTAPVTGETIEVKGATAEVPAEYLKWKANYAYTYLFKISDNTNGTTGQDVVGLYPLTFDAVTVTDPDGIQETITSVSDPSITTYAKGAVNDEYYNGDNIYVSLENPGTATLTTSNTKLYTATVEDGANQSITEESVANCLANYTGVTAADADATGSVLAKDASLDGKYTKVDGVYYKCSSTGKADGTSTYYTIDAAKITGYVVKDANGKKLTVTVASGLSIETEIAAGDSPTGVAISGNFAKFTPSAGGNYVFEYTDSDSKKHYKVIKVATTARS